MPHEMVKKIKWLGHAGFSIHAGDKVIVIDPYQVEACDPADILLITHSHFDHCSPEDIDKIKKASTVIVTEPESAGNLSGDVRVVKPGDTINIDDVTIEAVSAYNTNKDFHPQQNNWLGFIVTVEGVRIYHAGDTDLIPEMNTFSADIALLPVSGTYVMTADEAIEAAKQIKPQIAIPMHYDAIVGSAQDAGAFQKGLAGICAVSILSK